MIVNLTPHALHIYPMDTLVTEPLQVLAPTAPPARWG